MKADAKKSFDPDNFLSQVGLGRSITAYRRDRIVFSQGQPDTSVYYLQKGKVKLSVVSERGKEAVLAILGPGSFFGEGCLAGQLHRMSTARSITVHFKDNSGSFAPRPASVVG